VIGDSASLVQVVGDHEHRGAEFAVRTRDEVLQFAPYGCVDAGERFVGEQDCGSDGERSGERDALLLAA